MHTYEKEGFQRRILYSEVYLLPSIQFIIFIFQIVSLWKSIKLYLFGIMSTMYLL